MKRGERAVLGQILIGLGTFLNAVLPATNFVGRGVVAALSIVGGMLAFSYLVGCHMERRHLKEIEEASEERHWHGDGGGGSGSQGGSQPAP